MTLYTLESRIIFAGWTEETRATYKGPIEDVVKGITENVRKKLGATCCVCESGTAGPTGGNTRTRTPGYVPLAVVTEKATSTKEAETGLGGDREGNMGAFAREGLKVLKDVIKGDTRL